MAQSGTALVLLASLVLVWRHLRCLGDDHLSKLVMLMIWLRLATAALGDPARDIQVAGFSMIALGTLVATGVGLLAVPLRCFASPRVLPFYAWMGLGTLSGLLNGGGIALATFAINWLFFLACVLLLDRAFERHGQRRVLGCLIAVFVLPFAMQLLSLGLNTPKIGPDGSASYIGGYVHEAVYAIVALCALCLVCLYPWVSVRNAWAAAAPVTSGLLLANYRTMIVAALPLFLAFVLARTGSGRGVLRRLALVLVVLIVLGSGLLPRLAGERFQDIGAVATGYKDMVKPPEQFTAREKDVLSARVYIWSSYAYAAFSADLPRLLIGHGPEARPPGMTVHAHNEYLRVLYENGVSGLLVWLFILLRHLAMALRAPGRPAAVALSAGLIAMALGGMGTSLFNRPEGMILLAVICAATWHVAELHPRPRSRQTAVARRPDRPV